MLTSSQVLKGEVQLISLTFLFTAGHIAWPAVKMQFLNKKNYIWKKDLKLD